MLLVNLILNIFTPTNKPVWLIVSKLYLGKFDETASLDLYLLHDRFSSVLPPTVSVEVKRKTYIFPLQCVRKALPTCCGIRTWSRFVLAAHQQTNLQKLTPTPPLRGNKWHHRRHSNVLESSFLGGVFIWTSV